MKIGKNFIESKPVSQYTLEGKFIKTYNSFNDIANQHEFESKLSKDEFVRGVKRSCEGIYLSSKGSIYIYLENTWLPKEDQASLTYKLSKRIHQYTTDGQKVAEYYTAKEASDTTGALRQEIVTCASNRPNFQCSSAGGFIWLYQKDLHTLKDRVNQYEYSLTRGSRNTEQLKIKVVCLDLSGNYINTYDSLTHAMNETGSGKSEISKCCKGIQNTAGGYKWMYEEEYLKNIQQ